MYTSFYRGKTSRMLDFENNWNIFIQVIVNEACGNTDGISNQLENPFTKLRSLRPSSPDKSPRPERPQEFRIIPHRDLRSFNSSLRSYHFRPPSTPPSTFVATAAVPWVSAPVPRSLSTPRSARFAAVTLTRRLAVTSSATRFPPSRLRRGRRSALTPQTAAIAVK